MITLNRDKVLREQLLNFFNVTEIINGNTTNYFYNIGEYVLSVNGKTGVVILTKSDIGLSDVDNTSDANKPVSNATQLLLNNKLDSSIYTAADVLAKLLTVDTDDSGLNANYLNSQLASYYLNWLNTTNKPSPVLTLDGDLSGSATFTELGNATLTATIKADSHTHPISAIVSLQDALDSKTTESFVNTAIANLIDSSPGTLDTLNELAAALGDDPNFVTTVTDLIGTKLNASDYTATDILTKLLTLTLGAGCLLDADLLDSQHGAYYLDFNNATNKPSPVITLSGDATGTVTLTSLGNGSLVVTIVDNSHAHTIGNVTNLQSALDDRLLISSYTAADILAKLLTVDGINSLLNSDLLDDQEGVYYLDWGNTTNKPSPTITLTGDATGSLTLTSLIGGNLVVTVVDNSHAHTIANVTGLQTDLNSRLLASTYTAADILAKLLTVDGINSLLNADLLDDQEGVYYLDFNNATNKPSPIITLAGDATGNVTLTSLGNGTLTLTVVDNSHAHTIANITYLQDELNSKLLATAYTASDVFAKVLTLATGGGCLLDADLLDSQHGAYYLSWANTTNKPSPTITVNGDVSGSVTLTNLTSGTLTLTVADDSHNHIVANVDGLQTALDDKLSKSFIIYGDAWMPKVNPYTIDPPYQKVPLLWDLSGVETKFSGNEFTISATSVIYTNPTTTHMCITASVVLNSNATGSDVMLIIQVGGIILRQVTVTANDKTLLTATCMHHFIQGDEVSIYINSDAVSNINTSDLIVTIR